MTRLNCLTPPNQEKWLVRLSDVLTKDDVHWAAIFNILGRESILLTVESGVKCYINPPSFVI